MTLVVYLTYLFVDLLFYYFVCFGIWEWFFCYALEWPSLYMPFYLIPAAGLLIGLRLSLNFSVILFLLNGYFSLLLQSFDREQWGSREFLGRSEYQYFWIQRWGEFKADQLASLHAVSAKVEEDEEVIREVAAVKERRELDRKAALERIKNGNISNVAGP